MFWRSPSVRSHPPCRVEGWALRVGRTQMQANGKHEQGRTPVSDFVSPPVWSMSPRVPAQSPSIDSVWFPFEPFDQLTLYEKKKLVGPRDLLWLKLAVPPQMSSARASNPNGMAARGGRDAMPKKYEPSLRRNPAVMAPPGNDPWCPTRALYRPGVQTRALRIDGQYHLLSVWATGLGNRVETSHPAPMTLSPTLHPPTSTLNPRPSTLNPQPSTLNHAPSTLNIRPLTFSRASGKFGRE